MSERPSSKAKPSRARRHPLLYHQRLNEQYFWPATGIVVVSAALLVWNPPKVAPSSLFLVAALVCCALVLALTFAFRLRAYVTCTPDAVHVRLPFYRFDVPYRDIKNVRPTELFRLYPPREQSWGQRRFLEPLFGATVLVLELDALPEHISWLRFWMTKYMISPETTGLIIAVRDWMGFRAELDDFRAKSRRPPR
jgi:hypothetical protein